MANIETTTVASMTKPIMLASSVSRFCLRSLRFNAEFMMITLSSWFNNNHCRQWLL